VVGVDVELGELGEDLLVVVLHPAEELPQKYGATLLSSSSSVRISSAASLRQSSFPRMRSLSEAVRLWEISLSSV